MAVMFLNRSVFADCCTVEKSMGFDWSHFQVWISMKTEYENIEDFLLIKPRDVFSSFFLKEASAVLRLELRS